ncbi:CC-NBS-LRR resistance protein, partial [Trifolium medium]|nr:CC-NBS-LRR resistance protein [Trifolium medium]
MAGVVGGAFLSSVILVIREKVNSKNFRNYFHKRLGRKLEITLNSINEVLDDAETKQYQNLDVKNWLDGLKHELAEVDQLLDVIAIDAQQKGKIERFISGYINRFESRIKVLLKRLNVLAEQKNRLGLQDTTRAAGNDGVVSSSFFYESVMYGRELENQEIIDCLLSDSGSDNQVPIISIVGPIGMGKTTLAQVVYNNHLVMEVFELKAWVHVSESFDLVSLTQSILRSIHSSAADSEDLEILQHQLQQRLTGKRYLLVLDDVWNKNGNMWEHLLLLFSRQSSGSRIIVTTRDKEVASIIGSTQLLDLKQLEKSDCWNLFVKHAFGGRDVFEYPCLESIGKKIVE